MHFFLFLALFSSVLLAADAPALKIGVVAPLTGNQVLAGQSMKNALLLAQAETPGFKTELFFEDNQSTQGGTNLATRRLLSLNKVQVIFTPYTQEANIVAPLCDKAGVMTLSCCWNSDVIERSKYAFSNSVSYKDYGSATLGLLKDMGAKRVGLVWAPLWIEGVDWLKKRAPGLDLNLVIDERYNEEDRDFRTSILRLKEKNLDYLVIYLQYPMNDIFLKQLKVLWPQARFTGYLDIVADRSLIEGATYISEYPPIPDFYARYQKRFGVSAEQTLAPNVYDTYRMLARVYAGLPRWDIQAAADSFRGIKDFPGITGSLTCTPSGVFLSQTHVVTIKDHKKVFK